MPQPRPGESQDDFISRCIPIVIDDGTAKDQAQAFAICKSMFSQKAALTKDGLPASAFLVVEDPEQVSTWHLPVRDASGKPDHRLMGAAHAALLSPSGYRGQKYQGPGKTAAIAKLRKLYDAEDIPFPGEKSFHVIKQADGSYRWITISSSTFRDRDGEIITGKALADDIERCDASKDYGPLRWWHIGGWEAPDGVEQWQTWKATPGVDLGTCDFNMLHGKLLIESGIFKDAQIGGAFAEAQDNLEVSLAFSHPPDEPTKEKQFDHIHRFERSLMPAGWASNLLTKLYVAKGEPSMKTIEKLKALTAILRDKPDLVKQILADAEGVQKAAEEAGLEFKDVEEMISVPAEVTEEEPETKPEEVIPPSAVDEPTVTQEPVAEVKAEAAPPAPAAPPAQPETIGSMTPQQLADFVAKVVTQLASKKEDEAAIAASLKNYDEQFVTLGQQFKILAEQFEAQKESLLELTDSRPVGIKRLQQLRPTERDDNVSKKAAPAGPIIDPEFMNFSRGGK